jgi:hypothetical protein
VLLINEIRMWVISTEIQRDGEWQRNWYWVFKEKKGECRIFKPAEITIRRGLR